MSTEFLVGIIGIIGAIIGAIVGSGIGGYISFRLQRISFQEAKEQRKLEVSEAREQRELEVSEKKKALGYSLVLKMREIYSYLRYVQDLLEKSFKKIQNGVEPWLVVDPEVVFPDKVNFSYDELALVLSLKEKDLFETLIFVNRSYNGFIDLLAIYSKYRIELSSMLPVDMKVLVDETGFFGATESDQEKMRIFRPRMNELNKLAKEMKYYSRINYSDAETVLPQLKKVLNEKIGLGLKIEDLFKQANEEAEEKEEGEE